MDVGGSSEVGEVNDGDFLESWISETPPRNTEPPLSYCSYGSSSTSTPRMSQLVYNTDANLLLPNTALQIPSISDTISFATNSLVNTVMDGFPGLKKANQSYRQCGKRQQSMASSELPKRPRLDDDKDVLQPEINQHFGKSLVELQEKNSELKALLELQRQQNQLHKQISPSYRQVSSLPCFDADICIRRLMQYLYHKRSRPINNEIQYWRKFIKEYYAPCAKQRLCLSICENISQHALNLFTEPAMESWCCSICGSKSAKGFEVIYETFPRLFKTKIEGGMLDEILFLGVPKEQKFPSGLIMLEYGRAVQESIYENFRIVHEGILRVTFRHDLKIFSWEFCVQRHEELLQYQSVARQIDHFVEAAEKYRSTIKNFDGASSKDVQSCCDMFVRAERELARNVELPSVNDLGFSKKHFRCFQIAEVVGSMTDLIAISHELGIGPIESLKHYRRLKQLNEQRMMTHSVVTRDDEGLAGDAGYSQMLGQDARGSVARTQMLQPLTYSTPNSSQMLQPLSYVAANSSQMVQPSYSIENTSQIELTNERMKTIEQAVDKLLFARETACRVNNSLGSLRISEASGTATGNTIMLANAINFGENAAALAIAQANLMANAQLNAEMCKAAFNSSSSSTVNMSVKVEPWFQEQV